MNIHGALIIDQDITGIGPLQDQREGNLFWYQYSVITRSGLVQIISDLVADVHIATKQELIALNQFKSDYNLYRQQIAMLIGEKDTAARLKQTADFIASEFEDLRKLVNDVSTFLSKSRYREKQEVLNRIGGIWLKARNIKIRFDELQEAP